MEDFMVYSLRGELLGDFLKKVAKVNGYVVLLVRLEEMLSFATEAGKTSTDGGDKVVTANQRGTKKPLDVGGAQTDEDTDSVRAALRDETETNDDLSISVSDSTTPDALGKFKNRASWERLQDKARKRGMRLTLDMLTEKAGYELRASKISNTDAKAWLRDKPRSAAAARNFERALRKLNEEILGARPICPTVPLAAGKGQPASLRAW